MLIYYLSAIIFVLVVLGVKNVTRAISFRRRERKEIKLFDPEQADFYFYLVIPALREQNVIERTLEIISMQKYPSNMFEIIIALDKSEEADLKTKQATVDVLRQYIFNRKKHLPTISYVMRSGKGMKRSFQLNVALAEIYKRVKVKKQDKKKVFVGVYDADSYPDNRVLAYVSLVAKKSDNNRAFQQNLNYLLNSEELKKENNNILLANAYYQTFWNYIFEINRFLSTNKRIVKNKLAIFPPYCMGHGEFVRLDLLQKIKGFPIDGVADGIQLGFVLSDLKEKILPIPFEDYCESPNKLRILFKQHIFWLVGNLGFFNTIKKSRLFSMKFVQSVCHIFLALKWMLRPFFVTLIVGYTLVLGNFLLFAILVGVIWGYYLFGYIIIRRFLVKDAQIKIVPLKYYGLEMPLAVYFKSFGAVIGFWRLIKHHLFKSSLNVRNKVER